jgi:hypothetical protein
VGTNPNTASPFGTGAINDQVLGALVDNSAIDPAPAVGAIDYAVDLDTITYDIYVPAAYDGTEPYGLITFINSGDNGNQPSGGYLADLDLHKLIVVAADGAGNSWNVDRRMGRAVMAAYRARELFNIDDERIFAMGNSGGARTANMLAFQHPAMFAAALPRCGANYPAALPQVYETQDPNSNYEYWGPFYFPDVGGQPFLDWLRGFDQRFSLMTSFDDFREGDMMNIYHFGYEEDGFESRFLENTGGHCSTSTETAATNPGVGNGWLPIGTGPTPGESNGELSLAPGAAAIARDRLSWDDRQGAVVRYSVGALEAQNADLQLGVWPYTDVDHGASLDSAPFTAADLLDHAGIVVQLHGGTSPGITVSLGDGSAAPLPVFTADFSDWDPTDPTATPLQMKLSLWDAELQINAGAHFENSVAETGVRLLDDQRTIRLRFAELANPTTYWPATTWQGDPGAVVTLAGSSAAAGPVSVQSLSVKDAAGIVCP